MVELERGGQVDAPADARDLDQFLASAGAHRQRVAGRHVGVGRDFDVGRARDRRRRQRRLRGRLADRGDRGQLVVAADIDADLLPTSKPVAFVTGRLVEPAGIVIHGPVDTGTNTVVMAVAAVPTLAIVRVSPSMSIFWPAAKPAVLLR